MKILSCTQQKEADAYTIAHESILSINLMEKAAGLLAQAISERYDKSHRLVVFAGPGNNGGGVPHSGCGGVIDGCGGVAEGTKCAAVCHCASHHERPADQRKSAPRGGHYRQ